MSYLENESMIFHKFKKLIPSLNKSLHKGQNGRVAVLGGSIEYTGAPYFSAISALKVGADIAYVICEPSAASVIKAYSPDLIVHPLLKTKDSSASSTQVASQIIELLPRYHSLIIGPGLSRDALILDTVLEVIKYAKAKEMPMVVDADGLYLLQNHPDIFQGYSNVIITPNVVEFKRLCQAKSVDLSDFAAEKQAIELSKALGGVTILQKGEIDYAANAENSLSNDTSGGLKRCGGQGDLLSGVLGTFIAWERFYRNKEWSHDDSVDLSSSKLICCWAASFIIRKSSKHAFEKHGRATQSSDMIAEIGPVFRNFFEL